MINIFLAVGGIGGLLLLSEFLWLKKIIRGEYGRKLVHMIAGLFIASWPYFLSFEAIQVISFFAIVTLVVSRKFKLFHAVHDVKRLTYGELFYPVSILLIAMYARADWIFATAVLFVALADGMAAVFGKKWGTKKYSYQVGRAHKTVVGTSAYIVFAYVALLVGVLAGGQATMFGSPFVVFIWMPLFCAMLEAVSPLGTDNISVPLVVTLLLNVLLLP